MPDSNSVDGMSPVESTKPFPLSDFLIQIAPPLDEAYATQSDMIHAITAAEGGLAVKIAPQITPDFTPPDPDGNSPLQGLSGYFKDFDSRNPDQKPIRDAAHRFMLNVVQLVQTGAIDVTAISQAAPGQTLGTRLFSDGPNDTSETLFRNLQGLLSQQNIEAAFGERPLVNQNVGLIRTAMFRTAFATLGHIPFQPGMLEGIGNVSEDYNQLIQPRSASQFTREKGMSNFIVNVASPLIGRKV